MTRLLVQSIADYRYFTSAGGGQPVFLHNALLGDITMLTPLTDRP